MHPDHEMNRASWDRLAAIHGQDAYYDSEGLVAGATSLIDEEETALRAVGQDLTGRRVLHVQCHLGFDAITFARRGARVTGVDFSATALEKAASLARRCGINVEWVCADVTELPPSLDGRFDVAWATMGILSWIADVGAWMRSIRGALTPRGSLVLVDGHPIRRVLAGPPLRMVRPYGDGVRTVVPVGRDYAGTGARTGPQVEFRHSLGDIVSAAAVGGLRVARLTEHTEVSCDLRDETLSREADGRFRHRIDGHALPVLFTLIAIAA